MIEVYHNPRCGKSRNCLAFLDNNKQEYKITKYLEEAPSAETLKALLEKLQIKAIDLVRQKEKIWIENYKNQEMTDEAVIQAMVLHPILIERPIIIKGNKAIIAREMDKIETFFKES
jgi:arsenate reductase